MAIVAAGFGAGVGSSLRNRPLYMLLFGAEKDRVVDISYLEATKHNLSHLPPQHSVLQADLPDSCLQFSKTAHSQVPSVRVAIAASWVFFQDPKGNLRGNLSISGIQVDSNIKSTHKGSRGESGSSDAWDSLGASCVDNQDATYETMQRSENIDSGLLLRKQSEHISTHLLQEFF